MIVYGFLNYAYHAKTRPLWRGARTGINQAIGSNQAPPEMLKMVAGMDQKVTSILCIRTAEHILGLPPKAIKWNFTHIAAIDAKLTASETGIYDPSYIKAASPAGSGQGDKSGIAFQVPPFNSREAIICTVNLGVLNNHLNFFDLTQNKVHKAYVLLLTGAFMALGDRMFFEAAAHPETIPTDYNEVRLYKSILSKTKLHTTVSLKASPSTSKLHNYMHCQVSDLTESLITGYNHLVQSNPGLHIDDVLKLSAAMNQFTKVIRLAK